MNSIIKRKLVILTEGRLDVFSAKTAVSVIRYCSEEVVAVIDSVNAGKNIEAIIGVGKGIPIVSTIAETLKLKPTALLSVLPLPAACFQPNGVSILPMP